MATLFNLQTYGVFLRSYWFCCKGFKDPDLVNLLKYLIVIRQQLHKYQTGERSESDNIGELSICKTIPGPLPKEKKEIYPEKDIQVRFVASTKDYKALHEILFLGSMWNVPSGP